MADCKIDACDDRFNLELIREVFTEDAVWDGGKEWGVYRGRKEILDFFKSISDTVLFSIHYLMLPDITVEGDKAHGRWYFLGTDTLKDNIALWIAAFQDDKYERIDGRWWQKELKLTLLFQTPYEEGWHKKRILD